MAITIIPKKSSVTGKVPDSTSLAVGEIAVNLADGKIYTKRSDDTVINLSGSLEGHTHSISDVSELQTELDGKVDSVNGLEGTVVLDSDDIGEGTGNLYFTDARAVSAIQSDPSWNASDWDTAFSWGDHSTAGYALDSSISTVGKTGDYNDLTNKPDLSAFDEVLSYVSFTSFPASGETGKVYVAEDTGYLYRWSGVEYVQLTDQTAIWGDISGTLSNQTDLQNALDGKASVSHSHTSADLPSDVVYQGNNISLLTNDSGFITSSGAPVQSVNSQTGAVVLDSDDVGEGTGNLYFTDSRSRSAISVSGDLGYNSSTGVISFSETYSSASELLTAIKGVDGTGSGLDADLLDGKHASAFAAASHTHNYDNYGSWTVSDGTASESIGSGATLTVSGSGATSTAYNASTNTLTVSSTNTTYSAGTGISLSGTTFSLSDEAYTSAEKTKLAGIEAGATADQTKADIDALGIDADTLDGQHGAYYLNYNNLTNKPQTSTFNWQIVSTTATVSPYDGVISDTSGGAFTVTLPSSPTTGDIVSFTDSTGSWETNNLTIDGGTNQIITTDTVLICNVNYESITLVYGNGKWNFAF